MIRKAKPYTSAGNTQYVRLSALPEAQLSEIRNWLPESYIMREPSKSEPCIAYRDYEFWYEYCYRNQAANSILDDQL